MNTTPPAAIILYNLATLSVDLPPRPDTVVACPRCGAMVLWGELWPAGCVVCRPQLRKFNREEWNR